MKNIRIVFMGTPEFAVATLGSLLMNGFNVIGVVTTPDKPAGRGQKVTKSAVKEFAEFSSIPILQPENLKDETFVKSLSALKADIFIVVAFRKLPEVIWKMPPLGTINLHASLLPDYRGAAPINHCIINGETKTGVTTFFIDEKIDTGNIIFKEEVRIFPFENAGDLHDRLMKHGARLVVKTLAAIAENKINPTKQESQITAGKTPKTAPKIFPENCLIDWNKETVRIQNLVRGLAPYPGAKTVFINNKSSFSVKIFEAEPEVRNHNFKPGEIVSDGKRFLRIAAKDGFINIITLQLEGKRSMNVTEFLRGFSIDLFSASSTLPA